MTRQIVEAIVAWKYTKSNFKAIFGRFSDDKTYTKDFLQCPQAIWPTLDRVLARGDETQVPLRFKWPGGEAGGRWQLSQVDQDKRGQLFWERKDNSPLPWRLGDPATNKTVTIPGNPAAATPAEADAELARIEAANIRPWLIAVKLRGEGPILHLRAYLENPPEWLLHRGTHTLPRILREAIAAVPDRDSGTAIDLTQVATVRSPDLAATILKALQRETNVLLVGPPGTGKTVALEDVRAIFEGRDGRRTIFFDPDRWDGAFEAALDAETRETKTLATVFHPSYAYENFVAGLYPAASTTGMRLEAKPGPLLSLGHWAAVEGRRALLVIDEFNRGAPAAIFGDSLALLDGSKRDNSFKAGGARGAAITRPFAGTSMHVADEFQHPAKGTAIGDAVGLPSTLWILAALNSTDRSVAPLDAALRRRFAIIQVPPDYTVLARHLGLPANPLGPGAPAFVVPADISQWTPELVSVLTVRLLKALNDRIALILGEDFLLGHALLWSVAGDNVEDRAFSLLQAFDEKIAATLRLTFVDQDEALGAVLNAGVAPVGPGGQGGDGGRLVVWKAPPAELSTVAMPRIHIQSASAIGIEAGLPALAALI